MKLRVGDTVEVISGRDRGKKGKVERLFPKLGAVQVEGVNRVKKHLRPSTRVPQGGIVQVGRPIAAGKVMIRCPHCSKLTRVGVKVAGDTHIRVCKHCDKSLEEKGKK